MRENVVVNKTTSFGTTLKVTLEPLEKEQVRIIEYYRKAKHSSQFKRVRSEEGKVVAFEQLKLDKTFGELFNSPLNLEEAA